MNSNEIMNAGDRQFDMFRLSKAKAAVDLCSNSIRGYAKEGLPLYRRGRAVFVSKTELERFIRNPESFQVATPARRKALATAKN